MKNRCSASGIIFLVVAAALATISAKADELYGRIRGSIDVFPNNDTHPPQQVSRTAKNAFLTPAPNYPFPDHIPVLRGIVVDAAKEPLPDVEVNWMNKERVVTDSAGNFALPLRLTPHNVLVPIDAINRRTQRLGTINVRLPDALNKSQTIQIP